MSLITNVVLIDDDAIVLDSVSQFIGHLEDFQILALYKNAEDYLTDLPLPHLSPDHILLLDIGLPKMGGIEAIEEIKKIRDIDIIMLSTYEEEDKILRALSCGATSYISKRAGLKAIAEGLEIVKNGGAYLSPAVAREVIGFFAHHNQKTKIEVSERQMEILRGLTSGSSYQQIADLMNVSVETVRTHVKKLYRTLQVKNKVEAINLYLNGSIK